MKKKKESKNHKWNKNLWLIFGLFLLAIILPIYVYLFSVKGWAFNTTDKEMIDTIGGITAPIIGIVGALLVYISFRAQEKANKLISNQNDFKQLIDLINELKKDIQFLYDRRYWDKHTFATPFLAYLKKGDIKTIPAIFKRNLMYIFNDYIFLNNRINETENLSNKDIIDLSNLLENIFVCYLDNYCKGYNEINLDNKPKANLSRKLQELADQIANINEGRPTIEIEDELD